MQDPHGLANDRWPLLPPEPGPGHVNNLTAAFWEQLLASLGPPPGSDPVSNQSLGNAGDGEMDDLLPDIFETLKQSFHCNGSATFDQLLR